MDYPLEDLEQFVRLLHEVERVRRVARRPDEKQMTSTADHSFELAMVCWYIASTHKLDVEYAKVLKYALAHDLVEAYAGDTPNHDQEARKTKAGREAEALRRLEEEFGEFPDLLETIHEYELRETPEAKLVYAADKLIDPLTAGMETTQSIWKDFDMSWESFIGYKSDKVAQSEPVLSYWKQLVGKLEAKKEFFFGK